MGNMEIKKVFILLLIPLLVSGCNATYNIEIKDGKITEMGEMRELRENSNTETKPYNLTFNETFEYLYNNLHDKTNDQSEEKTRSFELHKINKEKNIGLKYKNTLDIEDFENSIVINECYDKVDISYAKNILKIKTDEKFNCFERFSHLDKVTINVTTDYVVKKNNADSKKDNKYTWTVTKDNATKKQIILELDTIKKRKTINYKLIVVGVGILTIILVSTKLLKRKNNKRVK